MSATPLKQDDVSAERQPALRPVPTAGLKVRLFNASSSRTDTRLTSWDKLAKALGDYRKGLTIKRLKKDLLLHFLVLSSFGQCCKYTDLPKDEGNVPRQPVEVPGSLRSEL